MKLYHGTTKKNAERILRDGFDIKPSKEMMIGLGVYLTSSKRKAKHYGDTVIEVVLPKDIKICEEDPGFSMGIFEDWKNIEMEWRESAKMPVPSDSKLYKDYIEFADDKRRTALKEGCRVQTDGVQYVVFDEKVLKRSRLKVI